VMRNKLRKQLGNCRCVGVGFDSGVTSGHSVWVRSESGAKSGSGSAGLRNRARCCVPWLLWSSAQCRL
jgi:hypothetical protein